MLIALGPKANSYRHWRSDRENLVYLVLRAGAGNSGCVGPIDREWSIVWIPRGVQTSKTVRCEHNAVSPAVCWLTIPNDRRSDFIVGAIDVVGQDGLAARRLTCHVVSKCSVA